MERRLQHLNLGSMSSSSTANLTPLDRLDQGLRHVRASSCMLLLDGCDDWLADAGVAAQLTEVVQHLERLCTNLRLVLTLCNDMMPPFNTLSYKFVVVPKMKPREAALLFLRCAKRQLSCFELCGTEQSPTTDPVTAFSDNPIIGQLDGHPAATVFTASHVNDAMLTPNEDPATTTALIRNSARFVMMARNARAKYDKVASFSVPAPVPNVRRLAPSASSPNLTPSHTSPVTSPEPKHEPWFFPKLDRENSHNILRQQPVGSFVVRPSSKKGCYACDVLLENGSLVPLLIKTLGDGTFLFKPSAAIRAPDGRTLSTQPFQTLRGLVDEHNWLLRFPARAPRYG